MLVLASCVCVTGDIVVSVKENNPFLQSPTNRNPKDTGNITKTKQNTKIKKTKHEYSAATNGPPILQTGKSQRTRQKIEKKDPNQNSMAS